MIVVTVSNDASLQNPPKIFTGANTFIFLFWLFLLYFR